jgi:hypothetical protein
MFVLMAFQDVFTGLDDHTVSRANVLLDGLDGIFTFFIKLTPEERKALPSIGDRRFSFVAKNYRFANRHSDLLPPFRDIHVYRRMYYDYEQLLELLDRVNSMQEGLRDTVMQIGANTYDIALTFYEMAEKAANGRQPGTEAMYKSLAKHFARINGEVDATDDEPRGKDATGAAYAPDNEAA